MGVLLWSPGKALLSVAVGVFLGTSVFTFWYAEGYSYMLDDPEVCVNCHIMRDNYNSWHVSSHRSVTCNGCHVPHELIGKYISKAKNGYHHSWAFTFGPPDVIRIREGNSRILNDNCRECHANLIDHLPLAEDKTRECTDCHSGVGHGK